MPTEHTEKGRKKSKNKNSFSLRRKGNSKGLYKYITVENTRYRFLAEGPNLFALDFFPPFFRVFRGLWFSVLDRKTVNFLLPTLYAG